MEQRAATSWIFTTIYKFRFIGECIFHWKIVNREYFHLSTWTFIKKKNRENILSTDFIFEKILMIFSQVSLNIWCCTSNVSLIFSLFFFYKCSQVTQVTVFSVCYLSVCKITATTNEKFKRNKDSSVPTKDLLSINFDL